MPTGTTDPATDDPQTREKGIESLGRPGEDAPGPSVLGDDKANLPDLLTIFQELAAFREDAEAFRRDVKHGFTGLANTIERLKPTPTYIDPMTKFWTVYQGAADEYDSTLLKKYARDLDTSLLFAGLFAAVSTAFIVQIAPLIQPDPSDLTNALLLRILQHNDSFGGSDPLAPVVNISPSAVRAQSILFSSLAVTLLVAFITALGKQWAMYYHRSSVWESITDRRSDRHMEFMASWTWRLHFIIPILWQLALLLFAVGVIVYLWDLDPSSADVMLAATCIGFALHTYVNVVSVIRADFPFRRPLSAFFLKGFSLVKGSIAWLRGRHGHVMGFIGRLYKTFDRETTPDPAPGNAHDEDYMKLSNPAFWRQVPLFTSPLPKDTAASAAIWLLEDSTDLSIASAVAAAFPEFQWPAHYHSTTPLLRFRDTYEQCLRVVVPNRSARVQALQSAAAYYVLYHTQLIWGTAKSCEVGGGKLAGLPSDLLLYKHSEEWGGYDLFEYLLRIEDRSEPVESARFLSYIAPYWFCGDSDPAIRFRSHRLQTLNKLIAVLESSKALVPATLADCVLCVGAAMDFPLHPGDLIRVDKSDYLIPTFKLVVEHIHNIALTGGRRYRHVAKALGILLTLAEHTNLSLALVDPAWINKLLKLAARGGMANEEFTLLLKLSAWRKEEGVTVNNKGTGDSPVQRFEQYPQSLERTATSEAPTSDDTLFRKVMEAIQTCGWQDEIVYGGLLAIRDVRQLGPSLFDDNILQTFHEATDDGKPLRVRQAAYDAVLVTQAQWLKSENLRQKLQDLGFFNHLHNVAAEIARSDYQRSFLAMMEVLSEDVYWHPYLREHMELWVPFRYEGAPQILHIIGKVGGLTLATPGDRGSPPIDDLLQRLMVEEWAAVPGRPVGDLTADRLKPLAEVTEGFKEVVFDDSCRKTVIATIEQVIPGLGRRYDYEGPGDDVLRIINDLLENLQLPSTHRSPHD